VDVAGRTALVTGASSGIGRATAVALAQAGARVLGTGRDRGALEDVARRVRGELFVADLEDPGAVERLAKWAGPVDVLVNNAGFGWTGPFVAVDPGDVERLIRVNLAAPIQLTRALVPGMLERGRGQVVNVVSIAGHVGVGGEAVYSGTKGGLIAFTEALRYELWGSGVGASLVAPGVVGTKFFEREGSSYSRRFPRPVRPEAVAEGVLRAIRRDRPEVFAPRWMAFPAWLHGAVPALYRRGARRWG
jgi:short-subunit dehydrogenase